MTTKKRQEYQTKDFSELMELFHVLIVVVDTYIYTSIKFIELGFKKVHFIVQYKK